MSHLLTDPSTVLVVANEASVAEAVGEAVLPGRASEVVEVRTVEEAMGELAEREDIGCVVVSDTADETIPETCEAIRDQHGLIPLLAYATDGGEDLAHRATRAGASEYLSASVDGDVLRESIDDAIETYEERRRWMTESDMFSSMLDSFDFAAYVKDEEARHLRKSSTSGDLKPAKFFGKTDVDVYGEDERESYEDDLHVIEEDEPIIDKETSFEAPDGTHYSRTTKVPWRDEDGEVKGLIGITRDVTEEVHQRQKLQRHQERLDLFARRVTHDLRNPLQIATGMLDLAEQSGDPNAFEKARDALNRIDEMLDDLYGLASEETEQPLGTSLGGIDSKPVTTRLADIVTDIWEPVATDGATLECEVNDDAVIVAPESSLRPLLENLFKNAIRHAGREVTVRVGTFPEGGFYVEDDGPGIPKEERSDVLERGYTTAEEGSGTGLSMVGEIADRRGWELRLTEGRDGGARVEFHNCLLVDDPGSGGAPTEELSITNDTDIGGVEVEGDATYDPERDRWTLAGGGRNVYRETNELHYAYTEVEGPVRIEGRIEEVENVTEWSSAGLMIRGSTDEGAAYGQVGLTAEHGTEVLWRPREGGEGVSQHVEETPDAHPWYRVERIGQTVTASISEDGEDWLAIDQRRVEFDDPICVGLAVCSTRPSIRCRAVMEDVEIRRLDPD